MIGIGVLFASQSSLAGSLSVEAAAGSTPAASAAPSSAQSGASPWTTAIVFAVIAAVTLSVLIRRGVFSPSRLKNLKARDSGKIPALGWLTMFVGGYLLWQIGAGSGMALAMFRGSTGDSIATQSMGLWAGFVVVAAAFAVIFTINKAELVSAGFRWTRLDGAIGLGVFALSAPSVLLVMLVSSQVGSMVRGEPVVEIQHGLLATIAYSPHTFGWWTLVGAVTLAAPIIEEILYRGCLQSAIVGATKSPMIAILVSSAIFASAHIGTVSPEALPGLFVLGIAFGMGFEQTGRISVPIVMHAVFNGTNVYQAVAIG